MQAGRHDQAAEHRRALQRLAVAEQLHAQADAHAAVLAARAERAMAVGGESPFTDAELADQRREDHQCVCQGHAMCICQHRSEACGSCCLVVLSLVCVRAGIRRPVCPCCGS